MDRIRSRLREEAGITTTEGGHEHLRKVEVENEIGPGPETDETDELLIDLRLLAGTGVHPQKQRFVRVVGSSMEPILSHGQIVTVEPVSEVQGDDLYVYWSSIEETTSIAILERVQKGLRIEKRGPSPTSRLLHHETGAHYSDDQGRTVEVQIRGRVVAALGSPAQEIARSNEAARYASL
jgi:hypothetical protein